MNFDDLAVYVPPTLLSNLIKMKNRGIKVKKGMKL